MIEQTEFAARRKKAAARLQSDALLITSLPNVRYLSGFTGSNAALVLTPASAILFTDPRYTIQAGQEAGCTVRIAKGSLIGHVAKLIARRRWKSVAFERNRISFSAHADLAAALGKNVRLQPLEDGIDAQRMIKSAGEIELIRKSVELNSQALENSLRQLKPTMSENEFAAEIEYQMRLLGAEGPAFESIVAAGPRSALPHARPGKEALGANRLLLMDVGALRGGYCSDMTRVAHLGKPGRRSRQLYRVVLEAQLAAIDQVRPGVEAASVDRAARRVMKQHGFEEAFVHSTGHGLGLEIHEPPRIGKKERTRLEAGMVITIEPGAYLEGFGGVRIEDTVVVTRNGCEVLTPTPKELMLV